MSFESVIDATTARQLRQRGSLKWTLPPEGGVGAFVAEMDFGCAPAVLEAVQDEVNRRNFGYLPPTLAAELGPACARWQFMRYGWRIAPERVLALPDVLHALQLMITHFTEPGSPVILPTPAYMPFLTVPPFVGREVIQVPMHNQDGYYTLDLAGIDRAFAAGARMMILCNPHNPTGRVYGVDELTALSEVVERHDGRVFCDEIWSPLVMQGAAHIPYAWLNDATARQSLTAVSASKAWNLAGLKTAQLIVTNDDDLDHLARLGGFATHGASTLGVAANIAAYSNGAAWLDNVLAYLDRNRRRLAELVAEWLPDARFCMPQGTYLAWLDCRAYGSGLAERLEQEAKVFLVDGGRCGDVGEGYLRLNFAMPRPLLEETMGRIGSCLRKW